MSQEQTPQAVVVRPTREIRVVEDDGPLSFIFDTAKFEHLQRIAKLMASAPLIPDHLKGRTPDETLGNCFLVVNQAVRWGFDPFAVAQNTYVVKGKLGFEGKLIAALVNSRAGLDSPLNYTFNDAHGDALEVTVIGIIKGVEKTVTVTVGQAKTDNGIWKKDPYQKLVYTGAIKWARRWCPETVLGVVTEDDIERWEQTTRVPTANFLDAPPAQVVPPPQIANAADALKTAVIEPEKESPKRGPRTARVRPETMEHVADPKQVAPTEEDGADLGPVRRDVASSAESSSGSTPVEPQGEKSASSVPADYKPDFDFPQESLGKLLLRDGLSEAQLIAYLKHLRIMKPAETALTQLPDSRVVSLFGNWDHHVTKAREAAFAVAK
jgi:hypothetical protein